MAAHTCVLVFVVILLCLALAGNVTSLTGYSWFNDGSLEMGLWRNCKKDPQGDWTCDIKSNIFNFNKGFLETTIIIILLIVACGMLLISIIHALSMFNCSENKCAWLCNTSLLIIETFIGGGAGFVAHIFAEIEMKDSFELYTRGWSNIAGWVGASIGMIAFILSTVMLCVRPKSESEDDYGRDFTNHAYEI